MEKIETAIVEVAVENEMNKVKDQAEEERQEAIGRKYNSDNEVFLGYRSCVTEVLRYYLIAKKRIGDIWVSAVKNKGLSKHYSDLLNEALEHLQEIEKEKESLKNKNEELNKIIATLTVIEDHYKAEKAEKAAKKNRREKL